MKKILLTGGGTAGHVTPNLALIPGLKEMGYEIRYIGSHNGIEKKLIEKEGLFYYGISSGKLRRYFDRKNFTDPFRVLKGYSDAKRVMREYQPDILFSKGGFVSVPVVLAAKKYKIPVIIHESDMTPGLANKLAIPHAVKVCHTFPETASHLPREKAVLTGSPIRRELLAGSREAGLALCGFEEEKPVILIIGGSQGSVIVNETVRKILPALLEKYQLIHLCGKGNLDPALEGRRGYCQFEYATDSLKELFAITDIVISRAGSNAICEFLALKKPSILIPLSAKASRGDQILNAESFRRQGFSEVILQEDLTGRSLMDMIQKIFADRGVYLEAMEQNPVRDGVETILDLIRTYSK
ncbi:undecaprenyldiphospho-muramoylpentapeptide beta-N-acetylglucosaminyltransferase [Parasporobacterium paucivorans]|uniref:UDP-N-acetylglucosamine--N-acetylmuramyl-(pentapeptide) pyrophosphoryl-undecaprenol N-acetylglucosamine transferase n=1 Tax=Parasporobacterium paucivorans DSM 15970 TaxID=1122934 RepID=A0A1M6J9V0_9FIRM|nr:undecaprenyldiphospho-muramoylpentapeptide beta-N-acetylglucosaminyltransferase [Parasporobacterium paucivorans]SHJ43404.1 UDP-N-acetylglucosamine-N-acetylmuramylpentapeptide N-acetylglucosamine transferase [Parasporobacterium paucivorans DSM 15970]